MRRTHRCDVVQILQFSRSHVEGLLDPCSCSSEGRWVGAGGVSSPASGQSTILKELGVHTAVTDEATALRVAELERELAAATARADVAEEQLQRVHIAVRAFKQSQTNAKARRDELMRSARAQADKIVREAKQNVDAQRASVPPGSAGLYGSWLVSDPGLDERLDDYLQSEFEPDRSRDWMLSE